MIGFVDKSQVHRFQNALNADDEFRVAAAKMNEDILLRVGADRCFVEIRNGQTELRVVNAGAYVVASSSLAIGGPEALWLEMLKAVPGPGYHDIRPAVAWHGLELSGDLHVNEIYSHAVSRMVAVLREVHSGVKPQFRPSELPAVGTIEPILGRYVWMEVDGVKYRVYFEEGGNPDGVPLICQHTAGADCRQWRWLMNDPVIQQRFRIIAPDLPYHGNTLPPEGVEWWKQDFNLGEELALGMPVALSHLLGLERPIFIGASVGGMIASDLPWKHPGFFRAVIACEVSEYAPHWEAGAAALMDPRCRNFTSEMSYCQAPTIPLQNMHQNTFINDQCAFGVLPGAVHYYFRVHDLRDKYDRFDTSKTAVYLMNGEYDLATPPPDAEVIASKIPGAKAIGLKGLGHFPHCEDYELFKTYLHPVLDEILAAETGR